MPITGLMPAALAAVYSSQRAVHVAVVGDADGRLPVGGGGRDDFTDPRGPVEHRVLGVQMQMDERIRRCPAVEASPLETDDLSTGPVGEPVENYTGVIRD